LGPGVDMFGGRIHAGMRFVSRLNSSGSAGIWVMGVQHAEQMRHHHTASHYGLPTKLVALCSLYECHGAWCACKRTLCPLLVKHLDQSAPLDGSSDWLKIPAMPSIVQSMPTLLKGPDRTQGCRVV